MHAYSQDFREIIVQALSERGMSQHHNPTVAGREAAQQALQKAGVGKPDFVFVFGSIGYDQRSLVRAVPNVLWPEAEPACLSRRSQRASCAALASL
jgi:hypothetical protein